MSRVTSNLKEAGCEEQEELQHLLDTLAENSNSELEAYRNLGYILGVEYHPFSDTDCK